MKIGIIGASGKAGSLIAQEARLRKHDVTAIVRDGTKVAGKGYAILQKDLFDLTRDDLKAFDAVVDAFGTAFDAQSAQAHQTSLKHLTDIFETLPDVRLLVIGGASSLYTDVTKNHIVLESIPEAYRDVPASARIAFAKLQKSAANWTYFSPAAEFDPEGVRTGKYVLGTDYAVHNSQSECYISYADYAIAMVDEIEEARFIGKRFTAAGERAPFLDGYYGTEPNRPTYQGASHNYPQLNYELSGKQYRLIMDETGEVDICFIDGKRLEYTQNGVTHQTSYECAKGADVVYFVNFEFTVDRLRTNITVILDLQTRLVTVLNTYAGFNPDNPTMCKTDADFGAIDLPGYAQPLKRHGYTTDLIGKRIHWRYAPDFSIIHHYYHPNFIRIAFTKEAYTLLGAQQLEEQRQFINKPYDEKTLYIKIREHLYVVQVVEQSMSRRNTVGNSMMFLMNTEHLHDVGRSFGHTGQFDDNSLLPENYLFGAFGEWVTAEDDVDINTAPPFYNV